MNSTEDKAAILSWNSKVAFSSDLTSNFTLLRTFLDMVSRHGGTNLDIGLAAATRILQVVKLANEAKEVRNAIIFFSDASGAYTPSNIMTSPSDQVKEKNYRVFPIGFNIKPGSSQENILKDIASVNQGKYFSVTGT